ncbi:EAL domain-containing protein [Microbacterium sp. JZ31]|uniref:EAL domain-containing protein n=1 Tax=Microbacterium sp. JZ31 TaxID=1906274 RepID=UPI0019325779|nr:EAL domain-containing protein [Microbacterium sp. JZ31]
MQFWRAPEPLRGNGHEIHFQRLIDVRSEEVIGYEALARFADGRPPTAHLAQAAEAGRLIQLEIELLRSAVAAARIVPDHLLVTINASAATITAPEIDGALPAGRRWGLELAETSRIETADDLRSRVAQLGALMLIDDAGAQHACLDWIPKLQPAIVKIDKSVVWEACQRRSARRRLDEFVTVSRRVGAKTLAEGVETELHERVVTEAGIDYAQGFRYGEPAAVAA